MAKPSGIPAREKAEAVAMIADGASCQAMAERFGVTPQTISNWLKNPTVLEEVRQQTLKRVVPAYSKALSVLLKQLDSDMPWIQQGAARDILTRYHDIVTGQDSREVVIRLEGAPAIGLPSAADDEPTNTATNTITVENPDIT